MYIPASLTFKCRPEVSINCEDIEYFIVEVLYEKNKIHSMTSYNCSLTSFEK